MSAPFERRVTVPVPAAETFAWHERPGAFTRLTPPWEPVKLLHTDGSIRTGSRATIRVKQFGLPLTWQVEHVDYEAGVQFADIQHGGPFAHWKHTHRVQPEGPASSTLVDHIDYRLPLEPLSRWVAGGFVRRKLDRMFTWRHRIMSADLQAHQALAARGFAGRTVAISGASGLLGTALAGFLGTGGHRVRPLIRGAGEADALRWDTPEAVPDLTGVDVVFHLAGENVAQRWTAAARDRILDSRVARTRALAEALADLKRRTGKAPDLICASAIGIYGSACDDTLKTEDAPAGDDFLAKVCLAWEAATQPARDAGVRVVNARFGVVLDPAGGALAKLLTPFKLGLGGPVGGGAQWFSWIALEDVVGGLAWIAASELTGPVNFVGPQPVRNKDFARALGHAVGRPAFLPAPAFALKAALGEMAQHTVLASQRVSSARLESTGYVFRFPEIEACLRTLTGRPAR